MCAVIEFSFLCCILQNMHSFYILQWWSLIQVPGRGKGELWIRASSCRQLELDLTLRYKGTSGSYLLTTLDFLCYGRCVPLSLRASRTTLDL